MVAELETKRNESPDLIVGADLFPPAWLALHLVLTGEVRVHWLMQSVENRLTHTLPYPHLFYLLGLQRLEFQHFSDSAFPRLSCS